MHQIENGRGMAEMLDAGWSNSHGHRRRQMPDARPKEIPSAKPARPTASRTIPPRRCWQPLPAKPTRERDSLSRRSVSAGRSSTGSDVAKTPCFSAIFANSATAELVANHSGSSGVGSLSCVCAAHRQQATHLVFTPMLFPGRPVLLAEMVAPLITTAIHHQSPRSAADRRRSIRPAASANPAP